MEGVRVSGLGLVRVRVRVVQLVALRTKRGSLSVELRHAAHADEAAALVSQPRGQWNERGVIAWEAGAHHDETVRVGLAGDVQSGRVLQLEEIVLHCAEAFVTSHDVRLSVARGVLNTIR